MHPRIYVYIYICISCRAAGTHLPEPPSPPVSIIHRSQEVFKAKFRIGIELSYIGSSWSSCLCSSMWRGPLEYITYEFVLTSPAVSCMSGLSKLDSFCDGVRWLYSCCFVGCCVQYLFNIAHSILVQLPSSFFSIRFACIHEVYPYSSIDTTIAWKKKTTFYFIGQIWLLYDQ